MHYGRYIMQMARTAESKKDNDRQEEKTTESCSLSNNKISPSNLILHSDLVCDILRSMVEPPNLGR